MSTATPTSSDVRVGSPRTLVPGLAVPPGVTPLASNNNLDVCRFDGRIWLAWRTAPTHFASGDARIEVTSAEAVDGPWRHEATLAFGADLREPRFVEWHGRLHLYVMELGTNARAFEPRRTHLLLAPSAGAGFGAPHAVWEGATVPWRTRVIGGRLRYFVYTNADKLYAPRPEPTTVEVWSSDDGIDWRAEPGPIHRGGTEFDGVELDDGSVLGVTRFEGPRNWGSAIMRGRLDDPPSFEASARDDRRKFDSPSVFRHGNRVLMTARRQVAFDGAFDQGWDWLPLTLRTRLYQGLYSLTRKRSTLWEIEPATLDVTRLADLPSRGDTSFAAALADPTDPARFTVFDYTAPLEGPDTSWIRSQLRRTVIVATDVEVGLT